MVPENVFQLKSLFELRRMSEFQESQRSPCPLDRLVTETKSSLITCLQKAGVNDERVLQDFVADDILLRPPFGFIHSLVRMLVTSDNMRFASNLFSAEELSPSTHFSRTNKVRE